MGNQLKFVEIISKDGAPSSIQMPDEKEKKKEEKVKSPTANKIAMFEKQQKEKDDKAKKPVKKVNKMKVGKLNSKFGNLNINPAAMKPGGRATISNKHKDDGTIDQQPKVEQATISKGKRRKRKKKAVTLDAVDKKEEEKEKLI